MVSKPVTLVRGGRRGVGGLETEMETFQFDADAAAPQEVVRGASFRAHAQAEVFSLFHTYP